MLIRTASADIKKSIRQHSLADMNTDIERAKELLKTTAVTCALCCGETTYLSEKAGIAPMLDFLAEGTELRGFSAADKIVGKAAAMLFIRAGVRAVFGEVMSRTALALLEKHGVEAIFDTLTDRIINRNGNGSCPMEIVVDNIENPMEAERALRNKLAEFARRSSL